MSIETQQGSYQFPGITTNIVPSTQDEMDTALQTLQQQKQAWIAVTASERVKLLDQLIADFGSVKERWVAANLAARGLDPASPTANEEWVAAAWPIMRQLRQLRQSLTEIAAGDLPSLPSPAQTRADGQVVVPVFPQNNYDKLFLAGLTAEVWMEPGVTLENLPSTQAVIYQNKEHVGKVALVLGAGNVASIGPTDILYKLFVEDQVVLYKTNPVNAYLGPLLQEAFHALIEPGYVRIVYGGALEGTYLCNHLSVEEVHITGSDKTFDAIVFGSGSEGAKRKATKAPLLGKRITGELGSVSPLIVVPGPWSQADLAYQGECIVSTLTNNAGFNCQATRVIMQHAEWSQRHDLMREVRETLSKVPLREAYYPGAHDRHRDFVAAHPTADQFGTPQEKELPWTLITDVDPAQTDDICFTTEAFCGLFSETALSANSVVEYIERAVDFANENIWGSLVVTILVHPTSLKDSAIADAIERAIANLRYGAIGINYWAGASYNLGLTPWGAFPGHPLFDIHSGTGFVHNTLMFSHPQKSVLRGPWHSFPKPLWFVGEANKARKVWPKLVAFDQQPSPFKLPGILSSALFG